MDEQNPPQAAEAQVPTEATTQDIQMNNIQSTDEAANAPSEPSIVPQPPNASPMPNGFPAQANLPGSISSMNATGQQQQQPAEQPPTTLNGNPPTYPPQPPMPSYNTSTFAASPYAYPQAPPPQQPPMASRAPMATMPAGGAAASSVPREPTRGATPTIAPSVAVPNVSPIIPPPNGAHGSPTRVYINQKVTPALLEGMKYVASREPEKPLKWLGEYLLRKSEELEGAG